VAALHVTQGNTFTYNTVW